MLLWRRRTCLEAEGGSRGRERHALQFDDDVGAVILCEQWDDWTRDVVARVQRTDAQASKKKNAVAP